MNLPEPLILFVPWLATFVAAWLTSARLPKVLNGLIIALFYVASVTLAIATSGKALTSDPTTNAELLLGYSAAIFGLTKPLMDELSLKLPSPLAALIAPSLVPVATQAAPASPAPTPLSSGTVRIPAVQIPPRPIVLPPGGISPTSGMPDATRGNTPPPSNG
jgi:hypothetical protein